jgi:hypothetical protein
MKKQTAVEWLQERYNKNINIMPGDFIQAKAMEKEQITRAIHYGCSDFGSWKDAEQYYNETYSDETRKL